MDAAIRAAHKRRLKILQIKAAKMGYNTPAEILMEIEDIKGKIKNPDLALS